jgi:hypothetical protein
MAQAAGGTGIHAPRPLDYPAALTGLQASFPQKEPGLQRPSQPTMRRATSAMSAVLRA